MLQIPKKLRKRPFTVKEAIAAGVSRSALSRWAAVELLEHVSRGVYQLPEVDDGTMEYLYQTATLRCGTPSCICLLSALEHYHLTDEITRQVWIMVPHSKRVQSSQLKLIRSRNPKWKIGIQKYRGYWITTLDRTLIEGIIHKSMLGFHIPLTALKQALEEKKTTLSAVHAMAKKMGVANRVRPYIEALVE